MKTSENDASCSTSPVPLASLRNDSHRSLNSCWTQKTEWWCATCSYHNGDFPVCSMCGHERDQLDASQPTAELTCCPTFIGISPQKIVSRTAETPKKNSSTTECNPKESPKTYNPKRERKQVWDSSAPHSTQRISDREPQQQDPPPAPCSTIATPRVGEEEWSCDVCTFINTNPLHLVCELCGHERKEDNGPTPPTKIERRASVAEEQERLINSQRRKSEAEELECLRELQLQELIALQAEILQELQEKDEKENNKEESQLQELISMQAGMLQELKEKNEKEPSKGKNVVALGPNTRASRCA